MVSLEGNSLRMFDYLSASEIWPDKRGGLMKEVTSLEDNSVVSFD
jgi:hypothetical protein